MKKITIADIVIVFLVLTLLVALLLFTLSRRKGGGRLIVRSGEHDYYYSAEQRKIVPIEGAAGVTVIEIADGKFRFIDSPCKNRTCINHGWIKGSNFPLICLPNGVTAYIEADSGGEESYDGVSF